MAAENHIFIQRKEESRKVHHQIKAEKGVKRFN
jgi:hypothetical protein